MAWYSKILEHSATPLWWYKVSQRHYRGSRTPWHNAGLHSPFKVPTARLDWSKCKWFSRGQRDITWTKRGQAKKKRSLRFRIRDENCFVKYQLFDKIYRSHHKRQQKLLFIGIIGFHVELSQKFWPGMDILDVALYSVYRGTTSVLLGSWAL